jgi:hypothetical protein
VHNTWMSSIEVGAKKTLSDLFASKSLKINQKEQLAVCAWIATKTSVAEYIHKNAIGVSQGERNYIKRRHMPPPDWDIWIGRYTGTAYRPAFWKHHGFELRWHSVELVDASRKLNFIETDECNAQSSTFVIGDLVIHVISCRGRRVGLQFPVQIDKKLLKIWPLPKDKFLYLFPQSLRWPPEETITDEETRFIASAFFNESLTETDALRTTGL